MRFSFDYYHNLEQTDLYLCNPDERELFVVPGTQRKLRLRFNDVSELTFKVDNKFSDRDGNAVFLEAYDYVRTKRLIYVTDVGWFRITKVDETDDGVTKQKNVSAESYQAVFKDKGFITEERTYCFYNEEDPYDSKYDFLNEEDVPSVIGQLSKQLGIKVDLSQGTDEPEQAYQDWTVTYITEGVKSLHRSFKDNATYGYDFMVNDAENAFKVVFIFDFLFKTIQIKSIEEVASNKADVIYTFHNFMKDVSITENADDIVTVLSCNGGNCDITAVNPTGTNYLCDFSYYMDETEHKWMSQELIDKLKVWDAECRAKQNEYTEIIKAYREALSKKLSYETRLKHASVFLTDLKNAHDNRSVLGEGAQEGALCGFVRAETVLVGDYSLDVDSDYESVRFNGGEYITVYKDAPEYVEDSSRGYRWKFGGLSKRGTADSIVADNMADENDQYWYFDDSNGLSYCKLISKSTINIENKDAQYECKGFDRFIAMRYPLTKINVEVDENGVENSVKRTTYVDSIQTWIDVHEGKVSELNEAIVKSEELIDETAAEAKQISDSLNIISFFADTPALFKELSSYWIEGSYVDDNISVLDTTTPDEEINLCLSLLEAGKTELAKVSQPRFSFSLGAIDVTKNYEFRSQMAEIEVGRLITIEKEEGLWYYPVLLELSMDLDDVEDFQMSFANALRLDDWGYTYADLIKEASSTSRQVSANWQEIMKYSKDRANIQEIIKNPLNLSLRSAYANATNQEFSISELGILGRKKASDVASEFEPEQVRLINNVLLFTDDNWKTLKTALGKINYQDPKDPSKTICKYGLAADVLIGNLLLGNQLQIHNADSSITLDRDGITIRKASDSGSSSDDIIFQVNTSGNLIVNGYATSESLSESMTSIESYVDDNYATIEALSGVETDLNQSISGIVLTTEDHEARLQAFSEFETDTSNALARIEGSTDTISASVDILNTWAGIDENGNSVYSLSEIESTASTAKSEVEILNEWRGRVEGDVDSISSIKSTAEGAKASVDILNTWAGIDENGNSVYSLSEIESTASKLESTIKLLATWTGEDENGNLIESKATIAETANELEASIESLVTWVGTDEDGNLIESAASIRNTVTRHESRINSIAQYGDQIAELTVKAGELEASIEAKVSNQYTGDSFGWDLNDTSFNLIGNGQTVLTCDKYGLTINGYVTATSFNVLSSEHTETKNRVADCENEIVNIKGDLLLKADASDYNDVIDRLVICENDITVNAQGLESKVSQTVFEEMGTRVSGCESSIKQHASLISAKVDSSGGGEDRFFAWSLTEDGFYLYNESIEVMAVTESGLYVFGEIVATKGSFQNGTFNNCIISEDCTINGTLTSDTICSHSYGVTSGSLGFADGKYEWSLWSGSESASIELNLRDYGYAAIELSVPGGSFFLGSGGSIQLEGSGIAFTGDTTTLTSDSFFVYTKEWNCNSLPVVSSDSRLKNSIAHFDDQYEVFFDSLVPVRYRYNDGTSNRYHSGFIAQEVDNAISESGLTRGDFAGLCIHAEGTEEERWGLRYGEFVSINTWQIQKLKARVAELENYIKLMSKQ